MRQQKAIANHLAASICLALAVPLAAVAAPNAAAKREANSSALIELASSATLMDAWRDYALALLKPDFSWASDADEQPARAPSLFERGRARLQAPASHFKGSLIESNPFHVAVASTRVSDTPLYVPASGENLLPNHGPGLQRYIIAPSISQRLGSVGSFSVSAIFAYQHFADIATTAWSVSSPVSDFTSLAPQALRTSDTSSGAGMRLDYVGAWSESFNWQFGVQSRINMDPMSNYRGLYAETGTFDIPSSANAGLGYSLTPDLHLDVGVEHIMYSQVPAFTSPALPARFLALLSSSVSPVFAWENLDVYSIGGSWRDETLGTVSLRYASREQPLPTSPLLQQALPPPSSHNYQLGYSRAFGGSSSLHLSASYAPTDYVLGVPLSYSVAHGGNQFQWEALWMTSF
jgi:hypothetical protein